MKFICEGLILSDAASTVSKACSTKTVTPALECIKISAQNDLVTFVAYDGEISIEKVFKAEVVEEGETLVNGRFLADFISKISDKTVSVSTSERGMEIKYDDSRSMMAILPASDFPRIRKDETDETITVKESDFKNLIAKTVFCSATDDSRPILKGCLLEAKGNELHATALDGFRMACSYCETEETSGNMKIVCPARTLTEIARMLDNEEGLKIYADKNMLSVEVKDTVITSRLYAGEFVRKENIFPIDFTTRITVKRNELIDSVERASILIRGDKNNLLIFDIKNGKIVINANSDMGKVEETVPAELDGKELKIAMNGKYLLDAIKALDEENILLSFNSSVSPFTLENVEDKRCQYLVLPVRTSTQTN